MSYFSELDGEVRQAMADGVCNCGGRMKRILIDEENYNDLKELVESMSKFRMTKNPNDVIRELIIFYYRED
jgi:hypothetical protein